MLVLVLEDDQVISRLVRSGLGREDITSVAAGSVAEGLEALRHHTFDVAILDLTLPDGSGLEVLARLKDVLPSVHVIVLSGSVGELDRVNALELGADDYVVKPFFARELIARVRAVQRRRVAGPGSHIRFGDFEVDLDRRLLRRGVDDVELSAKELDLLAFLVSRPGFVFSRAELLRSVWESELGWHSESTVTEHIRRLRAKIEEDPRRPRLIRTLRGQGYRFERPTEPASDDAPVGFREPGMVTSIDGRIVHVDDAAVALLGATAAAELLDRSVLDLVSATSRAAAQARLDALAAGLHPRSQILVLTNLQGVELPIILSGSPVRWKGQAAVRSELRHADDDATRFRELVTGVLSDVTDAVISTDMDLHIRGWNRAAERLYGWTRAEVLGRHALDVLDWLGDHSTLAETWEQLGETDHWHGQVSQRTRDGRAVRVLATITVIRDGASGAVGVTAVTRPVERDAELVASALDAETVADLRRGLHDGELEVYYQPVVDLADGGVITLEALVRWNHPTRGLLSPGSFLREAEESGLILELGAHVLSEACSQVGSWRRAGVDVNVAVNLSARELADPLLVDRITSIARTSGFDLAALWLEVTESALVADLAEAGARLHELARLGVGISIDDFGTGWASLTYLRQFPIHVLKIDRTFVSGLQHEPQCAAIIRSIVSLAAELDLVVVAEGIETVVEEAALRRMGCSVGQGFLYGHPVPAREVDVQRMRRLAVLDPAHVG